MSKRDGHSCKNCGESLPTIEERDTHHETIHGVTKSKAEDLPTPPKPPVPPPPEPPKPH